MSTPALAAAVSYAVAAVIALGFGTVYLTRDEFMPYHRAAAGVPWHAIEPRMRALLLALMRLGGAGLAATGVALFALLLPFREGQVWAGWALPLVGLTSALPTFLVTLVVRRRTGASTPVAASGGAVALIVVGFLLSRL